MSRTYNDAGNTTGSSRGYEPRRRWWLRLPGLALLACASYLLLRSEVYRAPATVDMASLTLRDLNGAPVPASLLRGRPVVLNFWAPWCGPCRVETPWLQHLQQSHPGVTVAGIETDLEAIMDARMFAQQQRITYPLALTNPAVQKTFGSFAGLPTTLYLSSSGHVVHTATGVVPERVMQSYLADAIAAK